MFDSLADRIRHDDEIETPRLERYIRWGLVAIISLTLFGGLYFVVQRLE